ncbi:asparaginase [Bordetella genomosp. 11]|uniref:L-asparaginase n=1 Tax=Bordetella genomosp. 11 TaxID=1416808 RepID=A0A261UMS9_9BORD|nr:asparaginase [Bordetella genomosp. 11]OZI63176.1 L-asparaginase [Bordetella genomosp. 11]
MPETGRRPAIAVLATGGTIAGAQSPERGVGYVSGVFDIGQLLAAVPALSGIAELHPEQIANVGSQDMRHDVWHALATRIRALGRDAGIDGIVVTHGTDTLEETAYFLDLVVPAGKPLVLTGGMRPATALGADGPANLYAAVTLAGHPHAYGRGALVLMNEDIHEARGVQKIAATGLAAFASPGRGTAGVMQAGGPAFHRAIAPVAPGYAPWRDAPLPDPAQWPRVGIVYAHADMQADVIEFMASRYQGLVLAGVGDGNATAAAMRALGEAAARGVAVVRASRTGRGRVGRNGEVDDDGLGFIAAGDLNPQKARVLLMLALMSRPDPATLRNWFEAA